jgi:hypothetical protein
LYDDIGAGLGVNTGVLLYGTTAVDEAQAVKIEQNTTVQMCFIMQTPFTTN